MMDATEQNDATTLSSLPDVDTSYAYVVIARKDHVPISIRQPHHSSSSAHPARNVGTSKSDPGYDGDTRPIQLILARIGVETMMKHAADATLVERYLYTEGEEVPRDERKGFCPELLATINLYDPQQQQDDSFNLGSLTGEALQRALAKVIIGHVQRYILYGQSAMDDEDVSSAWKKRTNQGQQITKPGHLIWATRIVGKLAQDLCVEFAKEVWQVEKCDPISLDDMPLLCRLFLRDIDRGMKESLVPTGLPLMAYKEGLRESCNRDAHRLGWDMRFSTEFGRSLYSSMRHFYEAQPWTRITNEYPLTISVTHPWLGEDPVTYCIMIMGRTDPDSRGVGLFKNVEQFRLFLRTMMSYPKVYSLQFQGVDGINFSDLEDIQENDYEIAHAEHRETYPSLFVKLNGMFSRGKDDIATMPFKVTIWMQAALRASISFAEEFFGPCVGKSMEVRPLRQSTQDMCGTYTVPTHIPGRDATVSIRTEYVNVRAASFGIHA